MIEIGKKIGCLTVIDRDPVTKKWICKCECGNIVSRYPDNIRERIKTCGDQTKHNPSYLEKIQKINDDITNRKKYGTLIIIKYLGYYSPYNKKGKKHIVECQCECGNHIKYDYNFLISLKYPTCKFKINHKNNNSNLLSLQKYYMRWKSMHDRCYVSHRHNYKWYGGRGIEVCDEWRYYPGEVDKRELSYENYKNYEKWLDEQIIKEKLTPELFFSLNYSVDRIDDNGPYAPWNCCLKNQSEQIEKQRTSQTLYYNDNIIKPITLIRTLNNDWKYIYYECKSLDYDINALFIKHPDWKVLLDNFLNLLKSLPKFIIDNYDFCLNSNDKYVYSHLIGKKYKHQLKGCNIDQYDKIKSTDGREYYIPEKIRYK